MSFTNKFKRSGDILKVKVLYMNRKPIFGTVKVTDLDEEQIFIREGQAMHADQAINIGDVECSYCFRQDGFYERLIFDKPIIFSKGFQPIETFVKFIASDRNIASNFEINFI